MTDPAPVRGFCVRHLRLLVLGAAAALVIVPFLLVLMLVPASARREHAPSATPAVILGVLLSFGIGEIVYRHARAKIAELRKAVAMVEQRERERDSAQEELIRKLQEERQLVREKMQFEAQLADYEKYAALAQLALGAAHEINNPLLGILSHFELELRHTADREQREEIEQCISGAKRISSTIMGLINYARPAPLRVTRVNLARLIDDTVAFIAHQPLFRSLHVDKRVAPDLPAVSVDPNQLSQVLMNLLLNAAQAMPDGGAITIEAYKVDFSDTVAIAVSDTGCGIPADILPHVFEPFFTTKRGKGTGLGLSISQAYVRSHGGDIRVESLPGHGTTVRVTVPIRQQRSAKEEAEQVVV